MDKNKIVVGSTNLEHGVAVAKTLRQVDLQKKVIFVGVGKDSDVKCTFIICEGKEISDMKLETYLYRYKYSNRLSQMMKPIRLSWLFKMKLSEIKEQGDLITNKKSLLQRSRRDAIEGIIINLQIK